MILTRYIARRFFFFLMIVVLGLWGIYFCLALATMLNRYLPAGIGLFEAAELAVLRIAIDLYTLLPVAVGFSSFLMSLSLFRSSEMVVVRTTGVSVPMAMAVPAGCAFLSGIVSVTLLNPLVANLTEQFRISEGRFSASPMVSDWIRSDEVVFGSPGKKSRSVIRATLIDESTFEFSDADIFLFNGDGSLTTWIFSESARLEDSRWLLSRAKIWRLDSESASPGIAAQTYEFYELPTEITRENVKDSLFTIRFASFWVAKELIDERMRAGFNTVKLQMSYSAEFAKPLLFAAFALVGAAFTTKPPRLSSLANRSILVSVCIYSVHQFGSIARNLAITEKISPLLASWAPPIVALALILTFLLYAEDG